MLLRWSFAAIHLIALGIGLGAVWARGRGLRNELDSVGLRRVFAADGFWGLAAILWIVTGLARAFAGLEKGSDYYLGNTLFWVKMALFALIILLEIWPMITLIRWRLALGKGQTPDTRQAGALATISAVQAVATMGMVLAATAMARGLGNW